MLSVQLFFTNQRNLTNQDFYCSENTIFFQDHFPLHILEVWGYMTKTKQAPGLWAMEEADFLVDVFWIVEE